MCRGSSPREAAAVFDVVLVDVTEDRFPPFPRTPEGLRLPVGSLFESLYEGLEVAGNAPEHPPVAGPEYRIAVQGLMQMWQESIENEKLIQELAGAVDVDGIQDRE
jgi:hypothetical protein